MPTSQKETLRPLSRSPSPAQPPPSFVQRYLSTCGADEHYNQTVYALQSDRLHCVEPQLVISALVKLVADSVELVRS